MDTAGADLLVTALNIEGAFAEEPLAEVLVDFADGGLKVLRRDMAVGAGQVRGLNLGDQGSGLGVGVGLNYTEELVIEHHDRLFRNPHCQFRPFGGAIA
jgi:hypothetical protein